MNVITEKQKKALFYIVAFAFSLYFLNRFWGRIISLVKGDQNPNQSLLDHLQDKETEYPLLKIDGDFGGKTEAACIKFFKKKIIEAKDAGQTSENKCFPLKRGSGGTCKQWVEFLQKVLNTKIQEYNAKLK